MSPPLEFPMQRGENNGNKVGERLQPALPEVRVSW